MKNLYKYFSNIYLKKNNPVSLVIFITNRCNARCSFCFVDFDDEISQDKSNELSSDEYKKISKKLKTSLAHINITGGEPFLRKDIDIIIGNFISDCSLSSVVISTNGSYPKRIKEFINNVCKKNINTKFVFQFSIDSFPEEHNKIRKIPGLFSKTIESYEIVKNSYKNCIATCNLTISEQNFHNIEDVYNFLVKEKKIETINPIIVRNEGVFKIPNERKNKILNAYKKITNLITSDIDKNKLRGFSNFDLIGDVLNSKNKISYDMTINSYIQPKFFTSCVAGRIFGVLKSNGDVYPCEILNKKIGNIKDYKYDFKKLWFTSIAKETRNWIKSSKCNCHWECIYSYNLVSNPKYVFRMMKDLIKKRIFL